MTSKLIPADPAKVMVIRKITPNITTCSSPFARFGRFKVGGRGTIVRLQTGSLAVFSPTALTPAVRAAVKDLGDNVGYLAALDYEHHIYLSDWARAFPGALVIGVEGLPEKREADAATAGTRFSHVFTAANAAGLRIGADFDREFDYEYVAAHANKELVFAHRPDRTLIAADLIFNLPAHEQYSRAAVSATAGLPTRFFTAFQNTRGDATWQKRFIWYVASAGDRAAFGKSCRVIAAWDFDRIVVCHGDVIETGGKAVFRKVLAWHLEEGGK